jgi:large subunit ribosomal protein L15
MQLHQIKPKHKNRKVKTIGRGGKRGAYSGKGLKGQKSRAGRNFEPLIRQIIKRYPKLKGYRFQDFQNFTEVVNLAAIDKRFESGDIVSPATLLEKRLIRRIKGKIPVVKILGKGKISKNLVFQDCSFSKSAGEAVKK